MTAIEFFKAACKAGRYKEKAWVYSVFGCTITPEDRFGKGRLYDVQRKGGKVWWMSEDGLQEFEGASDVPYTPVLTFRDKIHLEIGDIPSLTEPVDGIVGDYFVNWYGIYHSLGTRIPYQQGPISWKTLEPQIRPLFTSNILTPLGDIDYEAEDPKLIYVRHYEKFMSCMCALEGFANISVPSATPYTGRTDPAILVRRDELLEQHKDELGDPVVVAKIENELIALDKAFIEKDPDKGFLSKAKSFNVVRKKLFLMSGAEQNFNGDGGITLIPTSLYEGTDPKHLPAQINTLRSGSYSRGASTALGGEAVKFFQRVLQNVSIASHDCGTKLGLAMKFTAQDARDYVGRYAYVDGEEVYIETTSIAKSLIGKPLLLRSPQRCEASHTDFCAKCCGVTIASTPKAIAARGANIGSIFLYASMKKMHGQATVLKTIDLDEVFPAM